MPDPLTHHGRPAGADSDSPKREPLKRSNSVRRLDRRVLADIVASGEPHEARLAKRELTVRHDMETISQRQTQVGQDHGAAAAQIAATHPISPVGVDAMRYSQSLAEEAFDRANKRSAFPVFGAKTTPDVIGVSEKHGRIGVGFSGHREAFPKEGMALAAEMLDVQAQYAGKTAHWSGQLTPVPFAPIITESQLVPTKGTICAATRSTAATLSPMEGAPREMPRDAFSERDALLEAQSQSFTGRKVKPHRSTTAHIDAIGASELTDPVLKRSSSLQHIMESCDVCKAEFKDLESRRGGSK